MFSFTRQPSSVFDEALAMSLLEVAALGVELLVELVEVDWSFCTPVLLLELGALLTLLELDWLAASGLCVEAFASPGLVAWPL